MFTSRLLRRRTAALLVLAATLLPVSAGRGTERARPAACANSACRCGTHAPGVACCCAADDDPAGPSFSGGCGTRREEARAFPDARRPALLPPVPSAPAPTTIVPLDSWSPAAPERVAVAPLDPVPKPFA